MNSRERNLLKLFKQLSPGQQSSVLAFAEFLSQRDEGKADEKREIPQPVLLDRPERETVVAAIKRLTASYPMLDRDKLFNQTSVLMTQHIMQGREAQQVIDELESLFREHYETLRINRK